MGVNKRTNGARDLLGLYKSNPAAVLGSEGSKYVKAEPVVHILQPRQIIGDHYLTKPLETLCFEGIDVYPYPNGYHGIIEGGRKPIKMMYVHPNGSGEVTNATGENIEDTEKNLLIELLYESRHSTRNVRRHIRSFIRQNQSPEELSDRAK